jgi:drug/metabolite transporter (DMT)-like permease
LAYALAVLAALAFAFGTVLQQKGTLQTTSSENDPKFLIEILHKPVWLAGMTAQVAGWIFQAMALDRGPLVVVQSLTAMSLVIALPLGIWLTKQHIGSREWVGAAAVLTGIMLFLWAGAPSGGTAQPSSSSWWVACLGTLVLVSALMLFGTRMTGASKALLLGSAAGFAFGLQAAVTKTFVGEVGHGVMSLLADWSVYVLVASALVGFVLQQGSLKTGVLAPAIASSNAVTLFSSVVLGIAVYGEKLAAEIGPGCRYAGARRMEVLDFPRLTTSAHPPRMSTMGLVRDRCRRQSLANGPLDSTASATLRPWRPRSSRRLSWR